MRYPNPAREHLQLQWQGTRPLKADYTWQLSIAQGQIVKQQMLQAQYQPQRG